MQYIEDPTVAEKSFLVFFQFDDLLRLRIVLIMAALPEITISNDRS